MKEIDVIIKNIEDCKAKVKAMNHYINSPATDELFRKLSSALSKLNHFKDSNSGLWCTDRPDLINDDLKNEYFWGL